MLEVVLGWREPLFASRSAASLRVLSVKRQHCLPYYLRPFLTRAGSEA